MAGSPAGRSFFNRLRGVVGRTLGVTAHRTPDPQDAFRQIGFSQVGEDIVVNALFLGKSNGFYVDVGAHHPWRYSNTYFFYQRGWRGINIDARPGSMADFNRDRPKDINLELAVAEQAGLLNYYEYDEPAVNTLASSHVEAHSRGTSYKLLNTTKVHALPLSQILDEHLPSGQAIDFISIDAEGLDAQVVRSNDWERFRPTLVIAEDTAVNYFDQTSTSDLCQSMKSVGFLPISKMVHSLIFADTRKFFVDVDGKPYLEGPPPESKASVQ